MKFCLLCVASGLASMISRAPSMTSQVASRSGLWHDEVDGLQRHLAVVVLRDHFAVVVLQPHLVAVVVRQPHIVVDVAHQPLDGRREDVLAVVVVVVLSSRTALTRSSSLVFI